MPSQTARRSFSLSSLVAAALVAMPSLALAQQGPVSADPEFVNPRFGANAIPGVPVPDADVRNTIRWGLVLQYERNPVVGYRLNEEVGKIVVNRIQADLGVSWDFMEWGTARLVVPVAANWDTEIPAFDASGAGLGDISLGLQFLPLRTKHFNIGVSGDLTVPSGRERAYMGEPSIRGTGALQLMGMVGFKDLVTLEIVGNAGVTGRQILVTRQDFDHGPDLILSEALRLRLAWLPVDIAFTQALIGRGGFTNFFQGGAENGLEVYGGIQMPFRDIAFNTTMTVDLMAGRGTNQGYGTTDFRFVGGLTFTRNPGKKPRPEFVKVVPPPPPPPRVVEEVPPDDARVVRTDEAIEIRDPIEFFVDTANIKPESLPILDEVAGIINEDARIKHLVVEGHASSEGDFEYNYDLSKRRAESIYKQLILNGVSPDRISYRSFGEVRPKVEGESEDAWALNRRVEFLIVAQYGADTLVWPEYGKTTKLPWTGEDWKIVTPPNPDEIEEAKLRELYEKQKRDSFEEEPADKDEFSFEGEGSDEAPPVDEAVEEPEDELDNTSFAAPEEEEFSFEGEEPAKKAAPKRTAKPKASGSTSPGTDPAPSSGAPAEPAPSDAAPTPEPAEAGPDSEPAEAAPDAEPAPSDAPPTVPPVDAPDEEAQ